MSRRSYAGGARALTLTGPIDGSQVSLPVTVPLAWPDGADGPFSAVINRGKADEEKVLCDTLTGGFLSVLFRGYDGTTAQSHDSGASIEHVGTGIDFDEANEHVNTSVNVHGLAGGDRVVGELRTATLRNKTMSGAQNTFTLIPLAASAETAAEVADLHGQDVTLQNNIDTEAASRTSADAAEATARAAADTALQTAINNEASARIATDATLAPQSTTYTKTQVDAFVAALTPTIVSQQVLGTASVTFTGSDTVLLALPAITFNGTTEVEVSADFDHIQGSQDADRYMVGISVDGGAWLKTNQYKTAWNTDSAMIPVSIRHRFTPAAGSHTIAVRGFKNAGAGLATVVMGSGGAAGSNAGPGAIRISQVR